MAISVNANISSGDLTTQTTGTKTVTMPTGASATSIVILNWGIFTTGNNVTITPPSGWAAVVAAVTATNIRQYTFWSLGNNANLGFTFTNPGGSCDLGWVATDYLGCNTTTPIDATGISTTNSGASTISAAAVTVVTDQAWEIICESDVNDGAASATGFTKKDNGSTLHMRPAILYNTTPKSTGSTGAVTVSNAGSSSGQELIVQPFALRPAAAAGQNPYQPFPGLPAPIMAA